MRKTKLAVLLTMTLLFWSQVNAQEVQNFSLKQAQEYAKKHSFALQNSNLDVKKAQKKVWETIATGLPQVSASSSFTKNIDLPITLLPAEITGGESGEFIPVTFSQNYNADYGITVNQLIFDGSYIVGVGSAKIYLNIASQAEEKTQIEICNAASQAYYAVLIALDNLAIMEENLRNTQKQYSDTKTRFENGFVEEQDVDQMKLLLKKAENEILKAKREIQISKIVLKYTMGLDVTKKIQLSDSLANHLDLIVDNDDGFDYSSHIDYKIQSNQVEVSKKLLKLQQAAYLPTLNATYSWSKSAYGDTLSNLADTWYKASSVSLRLAVPIFSGGMRRAKVNQAKLDLYKAENDQMQLKQTLQKDYLTAVVNLQNAIDKLKNDKDSKLLAKTIYDKTTIKYNLGIATSNELAQNESQYIQAQGTYVASLMQVLNAKVELNKSIGKY